MSFPLDAKDPWVRKMTEADGHTERAHVLLTAPVRTLRKYQWAFDHACKMTGFTLGRRYLTGLEAALMKPRHRGELTDMAFARAQAELLAFADGAGFPDGAESLRDPAPEGAREAPAKRTLSPQGEAQDFAAEKTAATQVPSGHQEDRGDA